MSVNLRQAISNSHWQFSVRQRLRAGLGVEDIAVALNCSAEDVRREVRILRDADELQKIYDRSPK